MEVQERIVGDGFGQRERLTVRLRGLLRSYPRSIGIVKEILQNADDAGATRVWMVWDGREHPTEHLPDPRMSRLQGPALLFANDQVFTETDFEAIRSIGESSKASLGPKTGRFGLGFNTVYNVTDYPSFISGRSAIAFDPHRDAVAAEDEPTGMRWQLEELREGGEDWLRGFTAAGLGEQEIDFRGTIFRLPARTVEQAQESEICDQPFTRADFEQVLQDLSSVGDELLLFARNILELKVQEIDETGELRDLLTLSTLNRDQVIAKRAIGNAAVEGDTASNIVIWRADVDELPQVCYRHLIEVISPKGREVRAWQVVSGLFADSFNVVLHLNEEMLALREKALPWVGAAVRLDLREDDTYAIARQQGKLFCTFPLPEQTGLLPCHVNGCFDLDPSRRQISIDPDLYAEADRVRVAWNRALLEFAVPQAAAMAIAALVPDAADNGLGPFYDLWPDLSVRNAEPWRSFSGSLLERLSELPIVRTRAESRVAWGTLRTTPLPPPLWGEDLQEALRDDGLRLPDPELPRRLAKSVEMTGVMTIRYRPEQVRDWLRLEEGIEVSLDSAPRLCLRERSHIVDLLQFCVSDRKNEIDGLPLALCSDGLLRAFGRGVDFFLAEAPTRRLFAARPEWFIDAGIQSHTRLRPCPESGLYEMDLPRALVELERILGTLEGAPLPWDPAGEEVPNGEWLAEVLRFLYASAEALPEGVLDGIAVLPDHRGRLHPANHQQPLLLVMDSSESELVQALTLIDIDVIGAEPPLIDAIRNLHRRSPGIMVLLSGPSLALAIAGRQEALASLPADAPCRALMLDYLSMPTWIDEYDEQILEILRSSPLLRTESGRVVAASEPGVYISTGAGQPPGEGGAYELVDSGSRGRWRPLLIALGLPELDRARYIADLFLRSYADLTSSAQRDALRWLRDEVDLRSLASTEPELVEKLRRAPLVRGCDGLLHSAGSLYDPGEKSALLDQQALVPDLSFYGGEEARWRQLFAGLGLRESPQAAAILRHVDALCGRACKDPEGAEEGLRELLTMLSDLWPMLQSTDSAEAELLTTELGHRAWLPPRRSSTEAAFVAPEMRLYRGAELVAPGGHRLAASQMVALEMEGLSANFLAELGVAAEPPLSKVVAHLALLSRRWSGPGHGGLKAEQVSAATAAIYAFLGRLPEEEQLSNELREMPSVWDGSRFWRPRHAFATAVSELFGDRRGMVLGEGDGRRGLDRLGRRGSISAEDVAAVLAEYAEELGDGRLDGEGIESVLRLVRRYVDLEGAVPGSEGAVPVLWVPTDGGQLVRSSEVLVGDAPWLVSRLAAAPIHLLHPKINVDAIHRLDLRRISSATREELAEAPALTGSADKLEFCRELTATIHHRLFAEGVRRLLIASGAVDGTADLELLRNLRLRAIDRLVTDLRIDGVDEAFGREEVAIFADDSAGVVYISADHWDTVVIALSEAINRLLGERLDNLAHIEALLRTPSAEIEELLDHRRVPRLQGQESPEIDPIAEEDDLAVDELPVPYQAKAVGVERLAIVGVEDASPRVSNEVAKAALRACLSHEKEAGRKAVAMPRETPGYDVQSGRISDPDTRFIRVYGLDGAWDRLPVILATRDTVAARTFGRQYWLYVVERSRDPLRRKIYRIQDPIPRIASYALDQRWRDQAESEGSGVVPKVGWIHTPEIGAPAEIIGVERVGMFTWVRVRLDEGGEERRFFRPALDRVVLPT